jgi:hypothetical protein
MKIWFSRIFVLFAFAVFLVGQASSSQVVVEHSFECDLESEVISVEGEDGLNSQLAVKVDGFPEGLMGGSFSYDSSEFDDVDDIYIENAESINRGYRYLFYISGEGADDFETEKMDNYSQGTKWVLLEKFRPNEGSGFHVRGDIYRPYLNEGKDLVCEKAPSDSLVNKTFSNRDSIRDLISVSFLKNGREKGNQSVFDLSCKRGNAFRGENYYGYFEDVQPYCERAKSCDYSCTQHPAVLSYSSYYSHVVSDPLTNPVEASSLTLLVLLIGYMLYRSSLRYSNYRQALFPVSLSLIIFIPFTIFLSIIYIDFLIILERSFIFLASIFILSLSIFSRVEWRPFR